MVDTNYDIKNTDVASSSKGDHDKQYNPSLKGDHDKNLHSDTQRLLKTYFQQIYARYDILENKLHDFVEEAVHDYRLTIVYSLVIISIFLSIFDITASFFHWY